MASPLPIWLDRYVSLGTSSAVRFRVKYAGVVIYDGKAYPLPSGGDVSVKINDICADYVRREPAPTFAVEKLVGGTWQSVESVRFINDWSYDYGYFRRLECKEPIERVFDPRQAILISYYDAPESVPATINWTEEGEIVSEAMSFVPYEADDAFGAAMAKAGTWHDIADEYAFGEDPYVVLAGVRYALEQTCAEWEVVYLNAYGGYDQLLIRGNVSVQDDIERHTYTHTYDNRDATAHGSVIAANELTTRYTLRTGYMGDESSALMPQLLNSPDVWLRNLNTGEVIPVTLDNTTTEHKTFKTNGGRLNQYTFTAIDARNKTRR